MQEIKSLTGIRGLAAFYVIIFHWNVELGKHVASVDALEAHFPLLAPEGRARQRQVRRSRPPRCHRQRHIIHHRPAAKGTGQMANLKTRNTVGHGFPTELLGKPPPNPRPPLQVLALLTSQLRKCPQG